MMTTCCAIVGLVFLVLTNLAIIIAFATPYWMVTERINRGLWAYCDHQTCTWVFQESPYYLPGQDSGQCLHRGGTNSLFFFVLLGSSLLSACCCWCLVYRETLWLLLSFGFLSLSVCIMFLILVCVENCSLSFGFLSFVCMLLLVSCSRGNSLFFFVLWCSSVCMLLLVFVLEGTLSSCLSFGGPLFVCMLLFVLRGDTL